MALSVYFLYNKLLIRLGSKEISLDQVQVNCAPGEGPSLNAAEAKYGPADGLSLNQATANFGPGDGPSLNAAEVNFERDEILLPMPTFGHPGDDGSRFFRVHDAVSPYSGEIPHGLVDGKRVYLKAKFNKHAAE